MSCIRRAQTVIWITVLLGVGLLVVILGNLTEYQPWAPYVMPSLMAVSGVILFARGARYAGLALLLSGIVGNMMGLALFDRWPWHLFVVYVGSLFAFGLWPLFERDSGLMWRDVVYPWLVTVSLYLGVVIAVMLGALETRALVGATTLAALVLLVQSCQRAREIIRGPREVIPVPRAFAAVARPAENSDETQSVE